MQQLLSFFMSMIMLLLSLFGFGAGNAGTNPPEDESVFQPVYVSDTTIAYGAQEDQTLDLLLIRHVGNFCFDRRCHRR